MGPHACNDPLRCPECIHRFWKWAENHTRGRNTAKVHGRGCFQRDVPNFYEAAGKFIDVDARSRR